MDSTTFESVLRDLGIKKVEGIVVSDFKDYAWEENTLHRTMTSFGWVKENERLLGCYSKDTAENLLISFIRDLNLNGRSVYIRRYPTLSTWIDNDVDNDAPLRYCYTCRLLIEKED